jgi:hypothetical protein
MVMLHKKPYNLVVGSDVTVKISAKNRFGWGPSKIY